MDRQRADVCLPKGPLGECGAKAAKNHVGSRRRRVQTGHWDLKGNCFQGCQVESIVTGYIPILRAYGGEIVDDAGKIAIGSDAAVRALDAYPRMKALSYKMSCCTISGR